MFQNNAMGQFLNTKDAPLTGDSSSGEPSSDEMASAEMASDEASSEP